MADEPMIAWVSDHRSMVVWKPSKSHRAGQRACDLKPIPPDRGV